MATTVMNQWSQALQELQPTQGARRAPSAPNPGMGAGNVPYAPGVMSQHSSGLYGNLQDMQRRIGARQGMQQATGFHSSMPGAGGPPVTPPQGGMNWGPDTQEQVMRYLMGIQQSTGQGYKMTTTGGIPGSGASGRY